VAEAIEFAKEKNVPIHILGGGSNTIFTNPTIEVLVVKIEIRGMQIIKENDSSVMICVGAGENWNDFVDYAVKNNYSGIEALSAIPGTVGGTPIQNVGAYGAEVSDVIISVEVFDIQEGEVGMLLNEECDFSYRDSIFKKSAKDRYIITNVIFKLSKIQPKSPHYPGVREYFESKNITNPSLKDISQSIVEIRKNKLPDPSEVASCGSFFKNPFVNEETYLTIKGKYPDVKAFKIEDGSYKIPAGWILEILGYKGKRIGNLEFYSQNALVLTNIGNATTDELLKLVKKVQLEVKKEFGINIEPEPVFV